MFVTFRCAVVVWCILCYVMLCYGADCSSVLFYFGVCLRVCACMRGVGVCCVCVRVCVMCVCVRVCVCSVCVCVVCVCVVCMCVCVCV